MSRNNVILGILCVWVSIITLLPLYLLFTGYFSTITNYQSQTIKFDRDGVVGGPWLDGAVQMLKRGVHSSDDSPLEGEGREDADVLGHAAIKTAAWSNSALSRELKEAIFNDEQSTHPRAAFDLVVVLSSLLPKVRNISRISTPSSEAFRNYIAPVGLPVIFTDMLEGTKLSSWSWDYVKSKWGETVFRNTRQGKYLSKTNKYGKHYVNRVSVKLSDFIDIVTGKRASSKEEKEMYITKQRVIPSEALEAEFHYPPFYPGSNQRCYLEPSGWYVVFKSNHTLYY